MADAVSVPAPIDAQGNPTTGAPQDGGVRSFTPTPDIAGPDAPTTAEPPKLPEGYTDWAAYGQAVAEGKVAPPATEAAPKAEPDEAALEATRVAEAVKATTEGMTPEMAAAVTPFVEAFAKAGTLTDAEVTEAAKATGFSEAMVRQYMAGAEVETIKGAQAETALVGEFHAAFGGGDGYAAFQEWAATGLSDSEQATLNGLLDTNPKAALALAASYKGRMEAEGAGKPARDITRSGGAAEPAGSDTFKSQAEVTAAMSDPRYASDEAYRQAVAQKIGRSTY